MAKKNKRQSKAGHAHPLDQAHVLKLFKDRGKPLTARDVLKGLGLAKVHRGQVQDLLEGLAEAGRLIRLKGAFGLAESMHLITGVLDLRRSGVGYLLCDDKRRKDVFIHPRDLGEAWHGDRVAVALTRQRGKTQEGRVARILERGSLVAACRVERRLSDRLFLCRPSDPRHRHAFLVEPESGQDLAVGDVVTVKAGDRLDQGLFSGELLERLGDEGDADVQERLVKLNHDVPGPFPQAALDQAGDLPQVPGEADFAGRQDLRALDFVTIDGETARDFDDAIQVEATGRGYLLRVAIADVSHYVPEGSPLDREAQERGNSFYFPRSVEPMFPEALSNGLCSLNPRVPRLAMVAEMDYDARGLPGQCRFSTAVIESKARLTYDQVNQGLLEGDEEVRRDLAPVLPMLETAEKLARAIKARRDERGSLDFDLPEPVALFEPGGQIADIRPRQRHFVHQIIEEFMIAANEAVARRLTEAGATFPYRVHPEPDPGKLEALFELLTTTDMASSLPVKPGPQGLRDLLTRCAGTDLEFLVNRLLLRTMMQASYSVRNEGHFGLASPCYCHFTSPIRRYADLMVHRALKRVLAGQPDGPAAKRTQSVCEAISRRERVAMEAEREIHKRLTVLFLRDKVGRDFTGVINSLADFGFWVELTEVMAEGLVRLSTLTDDYYALFPERQMLLGQRTGRRFALGQRVEVTLAEVSLSRLEVNLTLSGDEPLQGRPVGKTLRARPPRKTSTGGKARRESGRKAGRTGASASPGRSAASRDSSSVGEKDGVGGASRSRPGRRKPASPRPRKKKAG
ncbi:ribonuclease R [Fundidesulfovibrio butyratiphilus]